MQLSICQMLTTITDIWDADDDWQRVVRPKPGKRGNSLPKMSPVEG